MRIGIVIMLGMLAVNFAAGVEEEAVGEVRFTKTIIADQIGHPQVGDIDGDGRNDIVLHIHIDTVNIKDPRPRKTGLVWYRWPDFAPHAIYWGDVACDRFALADLNGDGQADVVSGKTEGAAYSVHWYEHPGPAPAMDGKTTWKEHRLGPSEYIKDLLTGDVDGDGKPDVVARGHEQTTVFLNKGEGWQARELAHPKKEGMALADLDGDGDLDLVLNGFWLETPQDIAGGEFKQHVIDRKWFTQQGGGWQDNCCYVGAADINGDGVTDVILAHSEKEGYPLSWYSVERREAVKTGPWTEHRIAERFDWCETVDIGDIDADGDLDVLAAKFQRHDPPGKRSANTPPYPVCVFYNESGGTRWRRHELAQDGIYAGVLGDVGSDGDLDIVGPMSYWKGPVVMFESGLMKN